ncbi:pyridoxamine 5'-phosphate oxidase family protein [Gordonia soli]|uniref:Pyridoxamine 5'-phosphate oxidase N-terminal domain-containing protein n=1 Tax=Gordonia soli NBRC 108243 TaxID=1223545 RepID=M0QMF9_9ACTN|nr:pyridoxamine 5'-phosphate oxidase family protein [Gordonia soli]GAC68597.1 hypothetical protein GS4_16_01280 [Gordonia soli NBRC 108243]
MAIFHDGELRVQERAGEHEVAVKVGRGLVGAEIPDVAADFLEQQRLLFIGHRDPRGSVWASVLSGPAGFISVSDPRSVRIGAVPPEGDVLAGSLASGTHDLGLLAIEFASRRRMRINGRGRSTDDGVQITTDQVYSNCPKYISDRDRVEAPPGGVPGPGAVRHLDRLDPVHRELIRTSDTFFIATAHVTAGADVSHRGGNPGFVAVADDRNLSWPDYRGNSMYQTLGNLDVDPRAGLLFVDWSSGDLLQLTGTAVTDWSATRSAEIPGARRMVDFIVEHVVELPAALGGSWPLAGLARTNPPIAGWLI